MDILYFLGYFGALMIGLVLGLIGGGGSILTVPVLVYLMGLNPVTATAYSLFVVGLTALGGTLKNLKKGNVDFRTGLIFAIPAFIGVYLTRRFLVPWIPDELFYIGDFLVTKDIAIMLFFAIIMLVAALSMIFNKRIDKDTREDVTLNIPLILVEGLVVGVLTGLVGAGGGFLIIPALVIFAKLPMKKAVATSLLIIAIKSLIGFIGDVENIEIDWLFLISFSAIAIIGINIGVWLNKYIPGKKLKRSFGIFVILMAVYIIVAELKAI